MRESTNHDDDIIGKPPLHAWLNRMSSILSRGSFPINVYVLQHVLLVIVQGVGIKWNRKQQTSKL